MTGNTPRISLYFFLVTYEERMFFVVQDVLIYIGVLEANPDLQVGFYRT